MLIITFYPKREKWSIPPVENKISRMPNSNLRTFSMRKILEVALESETNLPFFRSLRKGKFFPLHTLLIFWNQ